MALFVSVGVNTPQGFDFTDEAYYLASIAAPDLYTATVSQFGFVYHPLYQLLGGDITALRFVNALVSFGLATTVAFQLLGLRWDAPLSLPVSVRAAIALSFASGVLVSYSFWLVTPNYNSLVLQALLLSSSGVLALQAESQKALGWCLLGIGGWLAFMAKPTTALALLLIVAIIFATKRPKPFRGAVISALVAVALVLGSAISIDGDVLGFVGRLIDGVAAARALDGAYSHFSVLRIDRWGLNYVENHYLWYTAILVWALTLLATLPSKSVSILITLASVTAGVYGAWLAITEQHLPLYRTLYSNLILWGLVLGNIATACSLALWHQAPRLKVLMMVIFFLVLPHAAAFGSNINYWSGGSYAGYFWLIGGLALLLPHVREHGLVMLFPTIGGSQFLIGTLLALGFSSPYRQPQPLSMQTETVQLGSTRSEIEMSPEFAAYLREIQFAASNSGFTSGTPMYDLTGQSPGVLFALGARQIGQAWVIGGYPGSESQASMMLTHVPCKDIAVMWVLVEPNGPRALPTSLLSSVGLQVAENFEPVAQFTTPAGAGGYVEPRHQVLLRPSQDSKIVERKCNEMR